MANTNLGNINVGLMADVGQFIQNIGQAESKARSSFGSMTSTVKAFADGVGAYLLTKAVGDILNFNDAIEKQTKRFQFFGAQSTASLTTMNKAFKEIYSTSSMSMNQAGQVIENLAKKTQLSGKAFEDAARQARAYAEFVGGDAGAFTGTSLQSMAAMGIDKSKFVGYTDMLYGISQVSNYAISIDELNQALLSTGKTFKAFGYNAEESAVFLAELAKRGIDAESITRGLNEALKEFATKNDYGSVEEAFADVARHIKNAKDDDEALSMAVHAFGNGKTGQAFMEVFRHGSEDMQKMLDTYLKLDDSMQKGAERLKTSLDEMKDSWKEAQVNLMQFMGNRFAQAQIDMEWTAHQTGDAIFGNLYRWWNQKPSQPYQAPKGGGGLDMLASPAMQQAQSAAQTAAKAQAEQVNNLAKATEAATDKTKDLQKAWLNGAPAARQMQKEVLWLNKDLYDLFGTMDGFFTKTTFRKDMITLAQDLRQGFTSAFTDIIMGTKKMGEAFRQMAADILASITRMVTDQIISQPLAMAIVNGIGGFVNGISGIGAASSSGYSLYNGGIEGMAALNQYFPSVSGFRAGGGDVTAGQSYMIGEAGRPEIFTPSMNGKITPLGGVGGNIIQNFTLSPSTPTDVEAMMKVMMAKMKYELASTVADINRRRGVKL